MTVSFLQQISQYTAESLAVKATSVENKAFLFSTLGKIAVVAFVAIAGIVLYASIGLTTAPPLLMASLPLTALPIGWAMTHCFSKAQRLQAEAQIYKNLSERDPVLRSPDDVFTLDEGNLENPALVALFDFYRDQVNHLRTQNEPVENLPPDRDVQFEIALQRRKIKQLQLETEIAPYALKAATVLQFIKHPEQKIDIDLFSLDLPGVGTCRPRSFEKRLFGRSEDCQPKNDDYFLCADNRRISLEDIEGNLNNIKGLRQALFNES